MLRHLLSATAGLIPAVIAVSTMALVVATGLATGHPLSLAQTSVPLVVFEEGNAIERFVKENSPAGASIGPPVVASGGDGQLTYSLSGDDATSFAIVPDTGQLLVGQSTSLDFESDKKSYSIIVTATGQSGQTASVDVTVTVEGVNEPPEFDIPSISFEVKENTPPDRNIGDPITAIDPEDDDVTYSLTGTNAGLFDVDASDGQVRTKESLNYEAESMYIVAFSASDPGGSGNSTGIKLTIKIRDVSTEHPGKPEKPSVSPKPGNGHEALAVTWAAPENSGPPITSYVVQYRVEGLDTEWKQVTIDGNGVETTISGLAADTKYEAQVRAVNDEGEGAWSGSGEGSTFASMPVNTPPEFDVNATSTLSVSENAQPGTAIGGPFTASDSDRQDDLTYSLAGDDSGLFSVDDLSGQISVGPGTALDHESPADSDRDNVYDLTVRVTDGKDEQGDPDNSVDDEIGVTVRVTDVNEPPEIVSSVTELETDENIATSLAPLEATDPEGHTVSWSLDPASPDGGNFSLSVTGTLEFKTAPDYESPTDVDRSNDYDIIVVATDDGQPPTSSRVSLMIRVVNIDEDGVVSLSTLGPQMGVAITAELVDPDGGVTGASWQWLSLSDSQEQAIAGATDSSYTPIIADDGSRLQATVSYADAHGAGKYAVGPASHPVGDDSNSPPVFAVGAIVARQVAENTPADANIGDPVMATDPDNDVLTYSLSGAGSDLFDIVDSSGQIKTSSPLDHESQPEFRMTVTATDPGGLAVSAEITITVTDIDTEAPGKPDAPSVVPNSDDPIEALDVSWPVPLNTGPEITGYVVQHRVEGSGDGWTRVVIDRNSVETTISGLVAETEYEAQVHAVNAEGTGVWSESGLGSTLATVPVNTPPEFDEGPNAKRSVEENTPADTMIGDPVTATDPNNDELAYSLAGPDSGLFYVNPLSGQISIRAGTALDHESPADSGSDNFYELTVQVTDGKDGEGIPDNLIDDEIGVTVTVADVNEPPEFTSSAVELEIEENSSVNTNVGNPIIATDPESTELTYSLTGADADSFDVDAATGQIRTLEPLDYEDQNAFALIMIATDEGDLMAGIAVNIHVTNVNEAPVGATAIEDRTVVESDGVDQFDVSVYFSDPDGDELIYSATSSDSEVARVGFIGATLAVTPAEIGTITVEVTATDPAGLNFEQSFTVQVVADQGGSGGSIPFIPLPPQESGGSSDTGNDQANLLSEIDAEVVPPMVSLMPGESVFLRVIAFNLLDDPLPASAVGVACTWSSDGGGSFTPNGTEAACATTFTAPAEGNGTITAKVTQDRIATHGVGTFVVIAPLDTTPGVEEEEVPDIPFPASVAGSIVSQPDGVLITSPNGLTMEIPAGAIDDDYLGAYIEDLASSEIDVPEGSDFIVGSHAGNFVFTDVAGNPIPGFRTNLPVRICLPITREDIDTAAGGIDGIRVVHQTPDGEFFHHPPDNDEANMVTCANVDRFSLYFVGLAVAPPTPTPMPEPTPAPTPTQAPTATPGPTPTPTLVPSPVTTPESTPVLSATADPTPEATPVLPITGDTTPGPQALLLIAIAAAIVLTTGLTIRRLFRQYRSA